MSKPSAEKYRGELIAYLEGYPKNGIKEGAALTKNGRALFGVINDANAAAAACLCALREGDVSKFAATYTDFLQAHSLVGNNIQGRD